MPDELETEETPRAEIPKLRVQRVGKKFRIVYEATRNVAKFNSGEPCDLGGFDDQVEAYKQLTKVVGDSKQDDPELEEVGA